MNYRLARQRFIFVPNLILPLHSRLNAFGFMASKEMQAAGAGNAWLYDQRLALRWIQQYITKFGGDPEKVRTFFADLWKCD